jgi:cell division protein FtsB
MQPLTGRILAHLPGARALWVGIWALVPPVNAGLNLVLDTESSVWEQSWALIVLNYIALSFAVAMTVWGTSRITSRLAALMKTTNEVLEDADSTDPFREMSSAIGPLAVATVAAVAFAISALITDSWDSAVLRGLTWFVVGIPLWTYLWTYGSLHLGLDRLGRERLRPETTRVDPGLALRPLGNVAFMALWMLLIWLVPLVLTGLPDIVGFALGIGVLAFALLMFFVSMLRLHRQIVVVKEQQLDIARHLYAEAYEPVQATPTLATLEQQRNLLSAADALERRARAIHDWPIDEGTFARVLTIATSVVAITIGRLILKPLGF